MIDTSVAIDLEFEASDRLPEQLVLSTLSLAELVLGPVAGLTREEREQRRGHLRRIELRHAADLRGLDGLIEIVDLS